jgi:iron complex outermembrane receptor protein
METPNFTRQGYSSLGKLLCMRRSVLALCLPFSFAAAQAVAQQTPTADLGRVEITSTRDNDTQQRRESTASKIVIGREEIERQGDANVGEILKRMPGISVGGVPGRGGGVRMRGLSQGYTQILLDGQRVPPGFSIESLTPEMVERIEIYRAPTAETGAQAIAGTINIITREGRRGMPSELKAGVSFQGGYAAPTASYVQYQDHEKWTANYTLSINRYTAPDHSQSDLVHQDSGTPANNFSRTRVSDSHYDREGLHATGRLQLKGDPGESLTLMPFVALSQGSTPGSMWASQDTSTPAQTTATTQTDNHFWIGRLNGQWKRKLSADSNMEWKFNVGGWNSHSVFNQNAVNTAVLPSIQEDSHIQDRSLNLGGKYTNVMGGGHQWVSGMEAEGVRRTQDIAGVYSMGNANGSANLQASSMRYAIYSQDEWQLTPHWGTHLGARYEELTTEGNTTSGDVTNRNSVFTPLLHAMWRPNPDSRDQVRMSLTRSFKTPTMPTLLARRTYTRDENTATNPDTMGNPNLKPEVATGLDVAVERYLPQGGVLSASAFYRRVQNLIRSVTSYESSTQRWVSTPTNISDAITQGLELEAKFGLKQWIESAPAVDVRSNVSFYQSRVLSLDGPNNRLDQQPSMTLNLGGDYRLRSLPLTVGGNYNYNPGYTTRSSEVQWLTVSQKRVMDVYGLWRLDTTTAWRLSLSNLAPLGYNTGTYYSSGSVSETNNTHNRSWTNILIQLEKKL